MRRIIIKAHGPHFLNIDASKRNALKILARIGFEKHPSFESKIHNFCGASIRNAMKKDLSKSVPGIGNETVQTTTVPEETTTEAITINPGFITDNEYCDKLSASIDQGSNKSHCLN